MEHYNNKKATKHTTFLESGILRMPKPKCRKPSEALEKLTPRITIVDMPALYRSHIIS